MKIKLMQITHDLAIGGLQQVVVNICRSINREKFDISVLCLRSLGEFVPEIRSMGIKVILLPKNTKNADYFSFLKVANILKKERIEVIHTHNTQPFIDGTIGALLSGVNTIVHTDHARDFPDKFRYMLAEHFLSYFAHKIIGVSAHTSANLINYEKINRHKVITIENGIDGSKFDIKIDKFKKKSSLGLPNDGPIIGLGVRLAEQKGITYLLKAMPHILKSYPSLTLIIAGEGGKKKELQLECKQLGISDRVLFLGARLDIPELLQIFDIYVLPSLWEGLPMVLIEAMASGCPIVATNVGGVSKIIENDYNGFLVPSRNSGSLANAILALLNCSKLRTKFSKNGKSKFLEHFESNVMTRKYEQLYLKKR